ncbi:hypothetical protein [Deinococcus altitudinis]|uniref:hypothetical protein n=1 Tax=Deinococcus altitudinis TaxID=468914 RepID=UPI0038925209
MNGSEEHGELGALFAAARELNSGDLGAADRFLAGWVTAEQVAAQQGAAGQDTVQPVTVQPVTVQPVTVQPVTVQPLTGKIPGQTTGQTLSGGGKRRHPFRVWASAALGLAAALGGLLVLRPAASPAELPASAAYSVYRSALGDGW